MQVFRGEATALDRGSQNPWEEFMRNSYSLVSIKVTMTLNLAMSCSVLKFVNRGINPQTAVIDFASGRARRRRRRRSRFPLYLSLSVQNDFCVLLCLSSSSVVTLVTSCGHWLCLKCATIQSHVNHDESTFSEVFGLCYLLPFNFLNA